jgi:hypothetical protein
VARVRVRDPLQRSPDEPNILTSLSKTAREYRAQAAKARVLADATTNPHAKKQFLDFERYWLDRALDYETAEWFAGKP